jgi:hypothetical protein
MNLTDYQRSAARFECSERSANVIPERLLHAIVGLASEVGEVAEVLNGAKVELVDELGDCLWYIALGFDAVGEFMGDHVMINRDRVTAWDSYATLALASSRLCDQIKKATYRRDRPLERDRVVRYLSEALSCVSHLATLASTDIWSVGQRNLAKLEARYAAA